MINKVKNMEQLQQLLREETLLRLNILRAVDQRAFFRAKLKLVKLLEKQLVVQIKNKAPKLERTKTKLKLRELFKGV